MTARKCAFCGGTPVTKEHGWPKWLENVLPNRTIWQTDIPDDFVPRSRGVRRSIAGGEVRGVCKSCNNGWMSEIEATTQPLLGPIIQGRETPLSKYAQEIIATWIIKTCLVLSLANPSRKRIEQAYHDLFKIRSPSSNYHVSIGGFIGHEKLTTVFHFQPMILTNKIPVDTATEPNVYFMTLVIGHFVGQVVHSNLPKRFELKGNRMHKVWPYEKDFTWTPSQLLNADELQLLAMTEFPWLTPPPKSSSIRWIDR